MRKPRKVPGVVRQYFFGQVVESQPAPIVCLWPFDASNAECVAAGAVGRVPATDATYQTFLYTTVVGEGNRVIAPTGFNTGTYIGLPQDAPYAVEFAFDPHLDPSETGWVDFRVGFSDATASLPNTMTVQVQAGDTMYGGNMLSGAINEYIGFWYNPTTGDYKVYKDGVLVVENYTASLPTKTHLKITVYPSSIAVNGGTVGVTVRTSPGDLLGTYPVGTTSVCSDLL